MIVAQWRYLLCDLLTDRPIAWLPLEDVSYDVRLSAVSPFQAKLTVADEITAKLARALKGSTGRGIIYTYRNQELWSNGHIVWVAKVSGGSRDAINFSVNGSSIESWIYRRYMRDAFITTANPSLLISLSWGLVQSLGGWSDISVEVLPEYIELSDAEDVEVNFRGYDAKTWGQIVDMALEVENAPEYLIKVTDEGGIRSRVLHIAKQINGSNVNKIVLSNNNITQWSETIDFSDHGNSVQGRGAAPDPGTEDESETFPIMSTVYDNGLAMASGYPQLDALVDFPDILLPKLLNSATKAAAQALSAPTPIFEYDIDVESTGWKPSMVGSPVRVRLSDLWHSPQFDTTIRPYGVRVTPGTRDADESHSLLFREEV